MERKRFLLVVFLSLCCLAVTGCPGPKSRPRDQLIQSFPSPDGKHTLNIYRNNGGATVDWSTTVSVTDNATGNEWNVYYHYHEYEPESVCWLDPEHVRIITSAAKSPRDLTLDIHTEYYESFDWRH